MIGRCSDITQRKEAERKIVVNPRGHSAILAPADGTGGEDRKIVW